MPLVASNQYEKFGSYTGSFSGSFTGSDAFGNDISRIVKGVTTASVDTSSYLFKLEASGTSIFLIDDQNSLTFGNQTTSSNNWSVSLGKSTYAFADYSLAQGSSTTAGGVASHAEGFFTSASALYSHAEGVYATASGIASHAEGLRSNAQGNYSHAEGGNDSGLASYRGRGGVATGRGSHAEGVGTLAEGIGSHAEGLNTTASGIFSHAQGNRTLASGLYSYAEGSFTTASGVGSSTKGLGSAAFGPYSFAGGYYTIASGSTLDPIIIQWAIGMYNTANNTSSLFVIGNGISDSDRSDLALFNSSSIIFSSSLSVTQGITASLSGTSSWANNSITASYALNSAGGGGSSANITGSIYRVPVFSGTNSLTASLIYTSGTYTSINYTGSPVDPNNPDVLYVHGIGVDTYNLISAHSDRNNYVQINVQNLNNSTSASSDIVATADNGTEDSNYINIGINSSGYNNLTNVGSQNDAYIYSTGNDLYIGNATPNKQIIIFNGGLDAINQSRIFVHDQGTIGINTATYNTINPPSLQVEAPNSSTYNLIQAAGEVDNYLQVAIVNRSGGVTASSDLVLYNNIDPTNQLRGYIDIGINSTNYQTNSTYPGAQGDGYVFTDSEHLILGSISSSVDSKITLFAGGVNEALHSKLILLANNRHVLTGSLTVSESITAQSFTGSLFGTSSWANNSISSSYSLSTLSSSYSFNSISASYSFNSTSASNSINSTSASYALNSTSASYSLSALSSSYSVNTTSASYALNSTSASYSLSGLSSSYAFNATSASYSLNSLSSSFATSASAFRETDPVFTSVSRSFATTGSNVFRGNQIISGSLTVTGSVTALNFTGSLFGTSSWSISSSFASSSISSSYALTASHALNVANSINTGSFVTTSSFNNFTSSYNTGSFLGAFTGSFLGTSSWANNSLTASFSLTSSNITGGTTNFIPIWSSNTSLSSSVILQSSNNIGVGRTPSYRLDVSGTLRVSSVIYLGDSAQQPLIFPFSAIPSSQDANGQYLSFYVSSTTATGNNFGAFSIVGNPLSHTTSQFINMFSQRTYSPTSGTGQYWSLVIRDTINQTGGANGITRGLYVTPVLTSAFDWRSIEWTNNTGWGLYGIGSANNYISGSLLIDTLSTSSHKLDVNGTSNFRNNVTITGSLLLSSSLHSYVRNTASIGVTTTIASIPTGSYTAGFFDYTVSSGSNARAGTLMSVWSGGSIEYTDNTTSDIGNTNDIVMSTALSVNSVLINATTVNSVWNVKFIYRLI